MSPATQKPRPEKNPLERYEQFAERYGLTLWQTAIAAAMVRLDRRDGERMYETTCEDARLVLQISGYLPFRPGTEDTWAAMVALHERDQEKRRAAGGSS